MVYEFDEGQYDQALTEFLDEQERLWGMLECSDFLQSLNTEDIEDVWMWEPRMDDEFMMEGRWK